MHEDHPASSNASKHRGRVAEAHSYRIHSQAVPVSFELMRLQCCL
jgi:hypothetical protein